MAHMEDCLAVENGHDGLEGALAMQRLINSGVVWKLQGSFGREAMRALESGRNMLGREPSRDYWGNRIPARHEVKDGTKGSPGLVADTMGSDWAEAIGAAQ